MVEIVYGEFIQVKIEAEKYFECYIASQKSTLLFKYFNANSALVSVFIFH